MGAVFFFKWSSSSSFFKTESRSDLYIAAAEWDGAAAMAAINVPGKKKQHQELLHLLE